MAHAKVEIGKTVTYESLESALREAAKDMGWEVSAKDKFSKGYRLGSVHETREYKWTDFNLRGLVLPLMQITVHDKGSTDSFSVLTGLLWGVALPLEVRKYLSAVSGHLE